MRRQLDRPNQIARLVLVVGLVLSILTLGATSYAAVPGTNDKIAFIRSIGDPDGEYVYSGVYIINADGTGQTRLTDPTN